MRKDIREFLTFLNNELLDEKQKLYKWQEQWIEKFLEEKTKEKANAKVLKREDNKHESSRPGRVPYGNLSGTCFKQCIRDE